MVAVHIKRIGDLRMNARSFYARTSVRRIFIEESNVTRFATDAMHQLQVGRRVCATE
jgi:hypothetical protein